MLTGFLLYIVFMQANVSPNVFYLILVYLLVLLMIQSGRRDKIFLKSRIPNYRLVITAEYFFLLLPLFFSLFWWRQTACLLIAVAGLLCIPHFDIRLRQKSRNSKLLHRIPAPCFEWKAGLRKNYLLIIIVWIIGFCTSFFVGSVPFAIFLLGIFTIGFYETGEPFSMLIAPEKNASRLLFSKMKFHSLHFMAITAPLCLAFLAFHHELWYIPVIEILFFVLMGCYFILAKYAFYTPNAKSPAAQNFSALGLLCAFVPFMLPVVGILMIVFYYKSVEKLNFYLDDFY